jgi:hypothetical protein
MHINNSFLTVKGLGEKVESIKQQLQITENNYNNALQKRNEEELYELALDVENLKRKQECFTKLLNDKKSEESD